MSAVDQHDVPSVTKIGDSSPHGTSVIDIDSPATTPTATRRPAPTHQPDTQHHHTNNGGEADSLTGTGNNNGDESEEQRILRLTQSKGLNWMHVKLMLVAGSGFMCDAYDLQVIGLVTSTIGRVYFPDWTYWSPEQCSSANGVNPVGDAPTPTVCGSHYSRISQHGANAYRYVPSAIPLGPSSAIQAVALCGTLAGQLLFGYLGDRFGRQPMFQLSLQIMVMGAILQAFSFSDSPVAVVTSLCLFRFFLGIGIGGDYPLSATLMAEYSSRYNRGMLVAAVFAMQGTGYLLADIWALIVSAIWQATDSDPDTLWRTILIFAAVPTAATIYARRSMPETPVYVAQQEAERTGRRPADMPQAVTSDDKNWTYREFFSQYWILMIGTAGCWFFLDTSYYSTNLLQSTVYADAGWVPTNYTMDAATEVQMNARAQLYTTLAGLLPGYWCTVLLIEKMGRFNIQLMGFTMLVILLGLLAGLYNTLTTPPFIALFILTFFFSNFGPNATTFVYPVEVYPTKYRSFGHGFSAACGKAGSIVGTFGFASLSTNGSTQSALGLLAGFAFLGFCCTWCLPETKQLSLDQASSHALLNVQKGSFSALFNYSAKYQDPVDDESSMGGKQLADDDGTHAMPAKRIDSGESDEQYPTHRV